MRAIVQNAYGGLEVLAEAELPVPEPGPGEIRVRVRAAGVNPTDWKHRAGPMSLSRLPLVLGWDVAGTVDRTGPGVTVLSEGDEVFGTLPYPQAGGAYAEYATAPADVFVEKPGTIDFVQAAALPLASLTAWQSLHDVDGLGAGQRVLIQGAAGGVGHLAVQIAHHLGAEVIATAAEGDLEFIRGLGADRALDYRATHIRAEVHDVDAALVPFAGTTRVDSMYTVRQGGT
ncbi:NADP-dependent oxidoreductase, partial [Streptomyces sp. NPDC003737]